MDHDLPVARMTDISSWFVLSAAAWDWGERVGWMMEELEEAPRPSVKAVVLDPQEVILA